MWSPETIGIWIGAVAQTVIVLSLFILREQIKSSKRIHESETVYDTFRFLGEIRDEIEHIDALGNKDFANWNDDDRRAAVIVCNRFNMTGALIDEKIVPCLLLVHRQLQLAHDLAQMVQGCLSAAPPTQDHEIVLSLQLQSVIFIQLQKHTRFYSDCSPLTEGQDLGVVGSQTGPRAPDAQLNPYPAAVK
jgi:hypothetical protein